ncbi:hypothetical protein [Actinocorallia herbida]|uniref:hypothetical protein n=1 Tax=Actinocorallia herbida TaxID=58109 RepID=UPI0011CD5C53|nr:hypothetical protein [Actinocorallia herbida]
MLSAGGLIAFGLIGAMLLFPSVAPLLANCATAVAAVCAVLALLLGIRIERRSTNRPSAAARCRAQRVAREVTTSTTVRRGDWEVTTSRIEVVESVSCGCPRR